MFRTSASARRGSLAKNKNLQQSQSQQEEETCPICFETLAMNPFSGRVLRSSSMAQGFAKKTKVSCDCGHYFCHECLSLYVATSINEGKTSAGTLSCPIEQCGVPLNERLIKELASPDDWEKHLRFAHARIVNEDPLLRWCPKPGCNGVAHLAHAPRTLQEAQKYLGVICDARRCSLAFCANCGCAPHPGSRCDKADDKDYFAWKKGQGADQVKPCPQCHLDTEKMSGGCPAMTCTRCHAVWCWNCHKKSTSNLTGPGQCNCHFYALAHAGPAPLRVQRTFRFLEVLELACYAFVLYKIVKTIVVDGFRAGSYKIMMLFAGMYLIHRLDRVLSRMVFLYFDSVLG